MQFTIPVTRQEVVIMKKPAAKLRQELARLHEELRQAETRDAERIGRIALKAGLCDFEVEPGELQSAFEEIAARFRSAGEAIPTASKATPGSQSTASKSHEA